LRAAVTHYGSHGNGHYVCYRSHPKPAPKPKSREDAEASSAEAEKVEGEEVEDVAVEEPQEDPSAPQPEQWWRFSDDSVYPVSEEEAHQGNVFMLFYERIDENAPSTPHAGAEHTSVLEEAPLPPADVAVIGPTAVDDEAITVALPDDDDLLDLIPPQSTPVIQPAILDPSPSQPPVEEPASPSPTISTPTAEPTLSIPHDPETEASDAESEDAPSTLLTSDYESEADVPTPPKTTPVQQKVSPHLMRTAGNKSSRGESNRQSLPMVSAT
jgi:ubiquitin carboxyl-terminal hydrolase 1